MERNNDMNTGPSQQSDHKPMMPKGEGPATVLVVGVADASTDPIPQCVREAGHRCTCVPTLDGARKALQSGDIDLMLLDACLEADALSLITESRTGCPWLRVIAWSREADSNATIEAIRLGASDYLHLPEALKELPARIGKAISQGLSHRRREQKLKRLMEACNTLRASKDEMSEQVDVLCSDLASAYRNIKDQMSTVEMTTEFRTLISQELDVEDMLRTTLEYILKKVGPTNGVVHLREAEGEYGIGAFVNYEWQDRNIMPSLEKLGELLCGPMQSEDSLMKFEDVESFARQDGVDPALFEDSEIVSFTCNRNGTCLAIVTLFRSSSTPFTDEMAGMLDAMRDILAEQLGRILRVYKRSISEWPVESEDESDWGDLAA
jgi:DNA-binding response OmpR family regulator